jgi:phosphatidylserine/phosphatidylglycerophosphate/cardiolipin synthase-like enzyme
VTTAPGEATPGTDPGTDDPAPAAWFLSPEERGNPHTDIDRQHPDGRSWTAGNQVTALVHGAVYFARLLDALRPLGEGDLVMLTDWRSDADERLSDEDDTEVGTVLAGLARRGVAVRGLVWRSHPDQARLSEQEAAHLADVVNEAGGQLLLDQRVRRGGSHHQKLVLVRRPDRDGDGKDDADVAFVGGIDLCHGRRDDERHRGDPQPIELDPAYGERPPWHDIQAEVRGPAIGDLAVTFRERWDDPTPLDHRNPWRFALARATHEPRHPDPLPPRPADPGPAGPQAVQVLRTYPAKRPPYPFAPDGERSIARAYQKAFGRARQLIYIEDQYLWSEHVARALALALEREPELRLVGVVPRYPEQNGRVAGPAERIGHEKALGILTSAGGERVALYDIENETGTPIYVHAKACVVDDVWATIGSDNLNMRSWAHDSELTCAVLDATPDDREPADPGGRGEGARLFARDLRLQLTAEHLGRTADDPALLDPLGWFEAWREAADALGAWYEDECQGPRPRGRVRDHRPTPVPRWARSWATPAYRFFVDPDGRPRRLRRRREF